jgi:hypothetical protein
VPEVTAPLEPAALAVQAWKPGSLGEGVIVVPALDAVVVHLRKRYAIPFSDVSPTALPPTYIACIPTLRTFVVVAGLIQK